jgi:hypothetical protein
VRLEADDHIVLRAEVARVVGGRRPADARLAVDEELEAALPDRRQVRPTRHHRQLDALDLAQARRQIASDGTRTINADPHGEPPLSSLRAPVIPETEQWCQTLRG